VQVRRGFLARSGLLRGLVAALSADGGEREGADAVLDVSLGDRLFAFDRMHEAQHRLGQDRADQPDLGDRRDVIMGDARLPQLDEQFGRRIRLDRIEHRARKLLGEEAGGAPCGVRANERDRLGRFEGGNYPQRIMVLVQLKGPPTDRST